MTKAPEISDAELYAAIREREASRTRSSGDTGIRFGKPVPASAHHETASRIARVIEEAGGSQDDAAKAYGMAMRSARFRHDVEMAETLAEASGRLFAELKHEIASLKREIETLKAAKPRLVA